MPPQRANIVAASESFDIPGGIAPSFQVLSFGPAGSSKNLSSKFRNRGLLGPFLFHIQ